MLAGRCGRRSMTSPRWLRRGKLHLDRAAFAGRSKILIFLYFKIQLFEDKWHFLQYAGRYVRRPPIAQRRITWIGRRTVKFWYKDKKLRRRFEVDCSLKEFVDRWTQHIPERYQHAVRSFWAVWSSRRRAEFSSYICSFRAEPKATPQAPPLGGFYKTRLRT
jgi:hypothetical protein